MARQKRTHDVKKMLPLIPQGGSGGVKDHGALTGLLDNDHPQYLLTTDRASDSDKLDGIDSTGFAPASHDHAGVYLPIAGKASDSDKLDNIDSAGFVQTVGDQTIAGSKTFSSIPILPASNPTTDNQAARKAYVDTKVSLTGNETVSGVKTFGSIPVLPASNPTTANQAARKTYVDTKVSLTGNETVSGVKTFGSIPVLPSSDPTTDNQAVRKAYVDNLSGRMFMITPQQVMGGAGTKPVGVVKVTASVYGVPTTAKAVLLRVSPGWATITSSTYLAVRAQATAPTGVENQIVVRPQVINTYFDTQGWCSLNASGEFWYEITASTAISYSYLAIIGYLT